MRDYLAALVKMFQDSREDSMIIFVPSDDKEAAYKDAGDYVYATIISRLGDMTAKASVIHEDSDRVVRGTGHDGFEFVHDNGKRSRFVVVQSNIDDLAHHEMADREILTKTVDMLVDQLWEVIRKHVHKGNVWFLTTPKLWFNFRAGKVEFRTWCTLVD
jgi:hypothetical protein